MNVIISAFLDLVNLLLSVYVWIVIARVIISWVNAPYYHPVVRFIYRVTEPVLAPLRRVIPPIYGIDFTPAVLIFLIFLLKNFILKLKLYIFYSGF